MEEKQNIIMLGVPIDREKSTSGSSNKAPFEIRIQSKEFSGVSSNFNINNTKKMYYDLGNVNQTDDKKFFNKLWGFIEKSDSKLICLGGDHSITFDVLSSATFDENTAVVWIDAHADLADEYPPKVFRSHGTVFTNLRLKHMLEPSQMLLIGGHAYTQTQEEYQKIQNKQITFFSTEQILDSPKKSLQEIYDYTQRFNKIYLSLDLDSLDQAYVPTIGTSEPFGLTPHLLQKILQIILPQANYVDIVETQYEKNNRIVLDLVCGLIFYILEQWNQI